MSNIKLEAMKEKIKDILEKHYFGRNRIEENCANELLDLYSVSCSNCCKQCKEPIRKGFRFCSGECKQYYYR